MDFRLESDGYEDNDDNIMFLLYGVGDGRNGSVGRFGFEGVNLDVEDFLV